MVVTILFDFNLGINFFYDLKKHYLINQIENLITDSHEMGIWGFFPFYLIFTIFISLYQELKCEI